MAETVDLRHIRGTTLRPGDDGFDAEVSGFQTAFPHRPDVVVVPADAADLAAAVAAAGDGPITVQRTGHGRTAPVAGGLLVSTRLLDDVEVDPATRTARVGAGAVWSDVVAAAAPHGLAPLSGSAPGVGVVGYVLGGGLGLLGRRYGWAGDHARVTGRAGEVVTGMEVDLFPVARIYGGGLYFDTDRIADVLTGFREWTQAVPDALTSSVAIVPMPDIEPVPAPIRGRRVAQVRIVFAGPAAEGERLVAPLRDLGAPLMERLGELPFAEATSIYNDPADPHAYLGTNAMLRDLEPAVTAAVVDQAPDSVVQVNHLGGALGDPARYLLRILSPLDWMPQEQARAAHAAVLDAAAPATVGRLPGFDFGPQ